VRVRTYMGPSESTHRRRSQRSTGVRIAITCLLVGCWTQTPRVPIESVPTDRAPTRGETPTRPLGRELFVEGAAWRYRWTATTGNDPPESGVIECRVSRVTEWFAGMAATVECDGNPADIGWNPGFHPIGGVWAGGDDGISRLPYMPTPTGSPPSEVFLESAERSAPIVIGGAEVGTMRMFRREGEWCRREEVPSTPWHFELCFNHDHIVRVELHTEDKLGPRHVAFGVDY
jgi:hypothetical protein